MALRDGEADCGQQLPVATGSYSVGWLPCRNGVWDDPC